MKVSTADGELIGPQVESARTFWARARGLLGRSSLAPDGGLWLEPGGSVHTLGMRFPIDVVFLNPSRQVLKVRSDLKPWRLCAAPRGTRSVLELAAGQAARCGLRAGHTLILNDAAQQGADDGR